MSAFSTERERHIHLARVYLGQAREFRQHPAFHAMLLDWTARNRRAAAAVPRTLIEQPPPPPKLKPPPKRKPTPPETQLALF
ncbi:hypothetical protein [Paraburkholderia sp. GAS32]|uniref:hypothetical protein n=1 Tax=Paraburkholderia sp. GAS32 TaxID=3035129 RepID=UPI003D2572AC